MHALARTPAGTPAAEVTTINDVMNAQLCPAAMAEMFQRNALEPRTRLEPIRLVRAA